MTATFPTSVAAARAKDLDGAREAYRVCPVHDRPSFGIFAVNYLHARGLEVAPAAEAEDAPPVPTGTQLAALLGLFPSPFIEQALEMSVEVIADLLAALAERDLQWIPGENGACGTLLEGPPEPADLHVVFDCGRGAWQRDDDRARDADEGDPCAHWFGPDGTHSQRLTWNDLQRWLGPLTPAGGIAPTTPPRG